MKRVLKIIALLAVLTLVLLATVSCSFDFGNLFGGKHSHAFGDWATVKDATCTEKGLQERTCSCGEKETQEINALGHTVVADAAVAATCTTDGLTAGSHCSICGEIFTAQEVIPAEHNWMQLSLLEPATCFTYGEERRSCRVCNAVENAPVEPLAHDFVLDEESQYHTCTLCNGILFAGHLYVVFEGEYNWVVTYELCENMGGHLVTITSAYEQAVITYLMNLESRTTTWYWIGGLRFTNGFSWITEESIEYQQWAPGQPSGGEPLMAVQSYKYSSSVGKWHDLPVNHRMGYVCEWELNITECDHIFTRWETIVEPTCWNDGEQYRICTYCGVEETEVLTKLAHNFVLNEESGIELCEHCNATRDNGHIYVLFTDTCGWFDAYSRCNALGGHLVTITDEEEQAFIVTYMGAIEHGDNTWIGGYFNGENWYWVTDEAFEYANWLKGEPNNQNGKEWVLHLYNTKFEWNDNPPISEKYTYLCEFECEE